MNTKFMKLYHCHLRRISGLVVFIFFPEQEYTEHADQRRMDETVYARGREMMILRYWPNEFDLSQAWEEAHHFINRMSKP